MNKNLDCKTSFLRSLKFGAFANILFITFLAICLVYYFTLSAANSTIEIFAYAVELVGFICFVLSIIGYFKNIKNALILKIILCVYCIAEIIVMLLEIGIIKLSFWDSMSSIFIVSHVIFSIFTMLMYLSLDISSKRLEITIIIFCLVLLLGSLGYRVYISVIINAVVFAALNFTLIFQISHEQILIQFYDDKVEPKQYKSTFFD